VACICGNDGSCEHWSFINNEIMKTTLTTFCVGQHARRFKNAARFRGEKEDVVFTRCFCCFQ